MLCATSVVRLMCGCGGPGHTLSNLVNSSSETVPICRPRPFAACTDVAIDCPIPNVCELISATSFHCVKVRSYQSNDDEDIIKLHASNDSKSRCNASKYGKESGDDKEPCEHTDDWAMIP